MEQGPESLRLLGVTKAYLTHLLVEVFLQACNALKRVDIETYTAAVGEGGRENEHEGQGGQPSPETQP